MADAARASDMQGWQVRFFTIWTGQTFSLVGSALVRFALIWWMTESTGSAATLATASLVAMLPVVALGPLVGTLVDRWRRRWIMAVADGTIALFTMLLAYLYWRGIVQLWHVYVILFVRALGTAFHEPAMTASTSLMVPKEQLTRVAGINQMRYALTRVAGAPLGALLVALLPIQGVLAIDILTALLAIGPLLWIDVPQPAPVVPGGTGHPGDRRSVVSEMVEGFRYLWSWRGLFIAVVTYSLVPFFSLPATSLVPLLVREHFRGGPAEYGWANSAFYAGSIVGGLLMSTWGGFRRRIATMLVGMFGFGLLNLVRGMVPANAFWLFIVATFLGGPLTAMFGVTIKATMQSTIPPKVQGRIFSLTGSLATAMGPLGLATLGPLADVIGVQPLFLFRGASLLLVALVWACTSSVRNLEDGPSPQT